MTPARDVVPLREAAKVWTVVAAQSFGGPAGQIAVMQRVLVEERRWIGQARFLHALSFCTLLPGPEAQQLAVYIGWLLNGVRGGLLAGWLFVLPGVVALFALSAVYVAYGDTAVVDGVFDGLAPAVLAIVVQAVLRVARRALRRTSLVVLAVASFLALAVFAVPFPAVVAVAGLAGWLVSARRPDPIPAEPTGEGESALLGDDDLHTAQPSTRRAAAILGCGVVAWGIPVGLVVLLTGADSTMSQEGLFFSGAALVTFGGAYAVLSYVAQRAVEDFGWLGAGEMARGLALAETTPGPLIMVVQFVAFVGAYRSPGSLDPWAAATIGALLTTWVTFVPSFVLVLLGAPYVERLRSNRALAGALAGVMAAVVGVIANLAVYFATHTLFSRRFVVDGGWLHLELPRLDAFRPGAVAIAALAVVLVFRLRWSVLRTLGACALVGLGAALAGQVR